MVVNLNEQLTRIFTQLNQLRSVVTCPLQLQCITEIEKNSYVINDFLSNQSLNYEESLRLAQRIKEENRSEVTSSNTLIVNKLIDVIENHIDNSDLNIDIIAKEIGMSRTNLYRKFQPVGIYSVNQLINKIRLSKAYHFLVENELSITDVSQMVGFKDIKYFCRRFKKEYHVSPHAVVKLVSTSSQTDSNKMVC